MPSIAGSSSRFAAASESCLGRTLLALSAITLSGKIVGNLDKTAFTFDFELNLPAKDAAAGMSCK